MTKFFDAYYWLFRVLIPGVWTTVLAFAIVEIHGIALPTNYGGLKAVSAYAGLAVACGLFFHYLMDFPRRRTRFREIEAEYGPIHFLLAKCKECMKHCRIEKSYDGISAFYFGILNNDVPAGTRKMIYYFSSVYLMFTHIAFGSVLASAANAIVFAARVQTGGKNMGIGVILFSVILAVGGFILTMRHAPPEKYLIKMFTSQKRWLQENEESVMVKLCKSYASKVEL